MRIGIDYTAALNQRAGIGRLTRELVAALLRLNEETDYLLVRARPSRRWGRHDLSPHGAGLPPGAKLFTLPFSEWTAAVAWQRLRLPLPLDWLTGRLDVYHSPDFVLPPLRRARAVVTIHDLSFLVYPQYADPHAMRYLGQAVPRALERADLVVADSEATRADLISLLGVAEEKVEVVHAGVSAQFRRLSDEAVLDPVRRRYGLAGPFILTVGTIQPRKNLIRLLRAYDLLIQDEGIPHRLLLAGEKGWLYDDILAEVERLGLGQRVRFLGFVPDEDLAALLSLADLFVYPSLYEGFGLPVAEALACGAVAVVSNASSLPEVAGDAALLVEPTDVTALAGAMHRALSDDGLRRELACRGPQQVAPFTWEAAARRMLTLYRRLGGG